MEKPLIIPLIAMSSEEKGFSFVGKLRKAGSRGTSLIVTIPQPIIEIMNLKHGQYLEITVKKARKVQQ